MKKNLTIIFISILLLCCGRTNQTESKSWNERRQKMEYTFSEYSEKIPLLTLPLTANCEKELEGSKFRFTDKEISKYGRDNCCIYGKLAETEKYTAIIYLYPADWVLPIIKTTDKKGNKISELELFKGFCGEDINCWGTSWFKINKNLSIQLNDSSIGFERDSKDEIIESTKKTIVSHKQFYITENGKIIEIKEKTTQ